MLLLVSGATKTVDKYKEHPNLGQLLTPNTHVTPKRIHENNVMWGCDNGCFNGLNEKKYLIMLQKIIPYGERLLFVTVPDVVCDKEKTLECFKEWNPKIRAMGLPTALVLQNGMTVEDVNWDDIDAIFIGGDNEYKLGSTVRGIVKIAKSKGKWVHMGRVNSNKRMNYANSIGCDSVDGSKYSMFSDVHLLKGLENLRNQNKQIVWEEIYE